MAEKKSSQVKSSQVSVALQCLNDGYHTMPSLRIPYCFSWCICEIHFLLHHQLCCKPCNHRSVIPRQTMGRQFTLGLPPLTKYSELQ